MTLVLKLMGAAFLVGIVGLGVVVYDAGWNGFGLFYRFAGREALLRDCTPPLRQDLIGKGFSPVDLAFSGAPAISTVSGSFGRRKSMADSFTFSDGVEGPRVDGRILCTVAGKSVEVDVEVDDLPRRTT